MAGAGDRDMLFLHRLQQRRLGAWRGAVDLVGHQQLRKHRTGNKTKAALPARAFLQHLGAENVGRHQVGCELNAPRVETKSGAHGVDQFCFRETGHANEQRVTAREDGDQRAFDHHILAENDRTNCRFRSAYMGGRRFSRTYDHVFQLLQALAAGFRHDVDSFRGPTVGALCNKRAK